MNNDTLTGYTLIIIIIVILSCLMAISLRIGYAKFRTDLIKEKSEYLISQPSKYIIEKSPRVFVTYSAIRVQEIK